MNRSGTSRWHTVIVIGVLFGVGILIAATLMAVKNEAAEPLPGVTRADAEKMLDRAIQFTEGADWRGLCLLPSANIDQPRAQCLREVQRTKPSANWTDLRIVGARPDPEWDTSGIKGWVLELCVPSKEGEIYSEFSVSRQGSILVAPYPTFWIHREIITGPPTNGSGYRTAGPSQAFC